MITFLANRWCLAIEVSKRRVSVEGEGTVGGEEANVSTALSLRDSPRSVVNMTRKRLHKTSEQNSIKYFPRDFACTLIKRHGY